MNEYRLIRDFGGKSGIEGRDIVNLGAVDWATVVERAREHERHAEEVRIEMREVRPWYPVGQSRAWASNQESRQGE